MLLNCSLVGKEIYLFCFNSGFESVGRSCPRKKEVVIPGTIKKKKGRRDKRLSRGRFAIEAHLPPKAARRVKAATAKATKAKQAAAPKKAGTDENGCTKSQIASGKISGWRITSSLPGDDCGCRRVAQGTQRIFPPSHSPIHHVHLRTWRRLQNGQNEAEASPQWRRKNRHFEKHQSEKLSFVFLQLQYRLLVGGKKKTN